jgi:hypothetical protein
MLRLPCSIGIGVVTDAHHRPDSAFYRNDGTQAPDDVINFLIDAITNYLDEDILYIDVDN